MKKIKIISTLLFSVLLFSQCDTIEGKFIEDNASLCADASMPVPIKKVLLEDYTGFKCGNCPRAAQQTEEILSVYCDHIIPVSIHVGYFATPTKDKYTTDYRTQEGNAFNEFFGAESAGLPIGMVNRREFNSQILLSYSDWSAAILTQIQQAPEADLKIETRYTLSNRDFEITVQAGFLKDFAQKLNLNVWLVEDSIYDWQKDYQATPQDIENYTHRHVFRKSMTGTWGQELAGETLKNKFIRADFSGILDEKLNENQIYIVAFISNSETKEVIQADMKKLKE